MTMLFKPSEEELELHRINAGKIGEWFGTGDQLGKSIAAIIIVVLLVGGIMAILIIPWENAIEFWKLIIPIVTLSLGYIFGVKFTRE